MLLYKCDGCGLEQLVDRATNLPDGWRELPPDLQRNGTVNLHVCPECFDRQSIKFAFAAAGAAFQMGAELARIIGGGAGQKGPRKPPRKRLKTKILEGEILP